jgi:hypothetical protein
MELNQGLGALGLLAIELVASEVTVPSAAVIAEDKFKHILINSRVLFDIVNNS